MDDCKCFNVCAEREDDFHELNLMINLIELN